MKLQLKFEEDDPDLLRRINLKFSYFLLMLQNVHFISKFLSF